MQPRPALSAVRRPRPAFALIAAAMLALVSCSLSPAAEVSPPEPPTQAKPLSEPAPAILPEAGTAGTTAANPAQASAAAAVAKSPVPSASKPPSYSMYIPPTLPAVGPVRLLVALHGVGDNGASFGKLFMPLAQAHGWLLAAPTFAYGDWLDPAKLRSEDIAFEAQLTAMMTDASARTGRELRPRVFLAGFSRGAQLASRFALFHPDRVAGVASMSAGAYTIPSSFGDMAGDGIFAALPLPYGTGDMASVLGYPLDNLALRQVSFLVTCGGDDINPGDVPRQWDGLLGKTRLARAQAFHQALLSMGVPTQLVIYPRVKHQVTAAMTEGVARFLSAI